MSNTNNNPIVDRDLLHTALCEAIRLNWFISDTSRVIQAKDIITEKAKISEGYEDQLAEAIDKASHKMMNLLQVIEKAACIEAKVSDHKYPVGLFDIPEEY